MKHQKGLSTTPANAENNHNLKFGDQLRLQENMPKPTPNLNTAEPIENTPFMIRCIDDEWIVTMGDQALTHKYKTKEEALNQLDKEKWMVITAICTTVFRYLQAETLAGKNITDELRLQQKIQNEDVAG